MPFPITCAACHKTFSIADDVYERKVKGRVVTIKCKQCHAGIRVDGTKDTPVFSLTDSVRPPPAAPAAAAPAATQPEAAVPPAAALPQEQPKPATPPETAAPKAAPAATPAAAAPKAAPAAAAPKAVTAAATPKAVPAGAAPKAEPVAAAPKGTLGATATPRAAPLTATGRAQAAVAPAGNAQARATAGKTLLGMKPPPAATPAPAAVKAAPPPPASAPQAAATPAATAVLWAVDYPDGEDREFTLLQIEKELASGAINPTTLVWREGMDEWLEIGQVPELRALTERKAPAPLAAQRPKAASAPTLPEPRAKAASAPTLPEPRAKAASAPVLPELSATLPQPNAPQRPPAPSASDLDQPRKGLTPPPAPFPKPAAPASLEARPAPSPFAQPISALTPQAFPAANAPFAAAPFPAQPAASPPFGRPSPTPFGAVAPVGGATEWPKKSRAPLIIGGIALIAVAALVFVLTRSSDEVPPPAPITALPAAAPTTPAAPRTAEPAPASDTETAANQRTGSSSAIEPPSGAPMATPNAGFAELFASGARTADEKHGVTGPTQRFDANAAKAALATAATHTPPCREKGGPTGKATVVVTFDPSGKVSSATVSDPPFAGTSSGACIAAALKRATVPAFSGLPGTVTKIISIQ